MSTWTARRRASSAGCLVCKFFMASAAAFPEPLAPRREWNARVGIREVLLWPKDRAVPRTYATVRVGCAVAEGPADRSSVTAIAGVAAGKGTVARECPGCGEVSGEQVIKVGTTALEYSAGVEGGIACCGAGRRQAIDAGQLGCER